MNLFIAVLLKLINASMCTDSVISDLFEGVWKWWVNRFKLLQLYTINSTMKSQRDEGFKSCCAIRVRQWWSSNKTKIQHEQKWEMEKKYPKVH